MCVRPGYFMEKEQKQRSEDAEEPHWLTVVTIRWWNNRWVVCFFFFFVPFIFSFIFKKVSITYIPKKHLKRKNDSWNNLLIQSILSIKLLWRCKKRLPAITSWYRMETSSCWSPDRVGKPAVVHVASAVVPVAPLCSKCYTIKKNCTISHQTEAPQVL